MNKSILLRWLLNDVAQNAHLYYRKPGRKLTDLLFELNARREVSLPQRLPKEEHSLLVSLREYFRDDVTLISLVMHDRFPNRYIFYRYSQLEPEIFDGLAFFSEIEPLFDFPFQSIGKRGVERYLTLNHAMLSFADQHWPKQKTKRDASLAYFFYNGLANLFRQENEYRRHWVLITREHKRLNKTRITWSGRKEMRKGDLVFAYRTAPVSALTDLFRVIDAPSFDPWGGWHGFWVEMKKIMTFPAISLAKMKEDPILAQWSLVRRQFQGIVEAMPPVIYNRLLEEIPKSDREKHQLHPEVITTGSHSGEFVSEKDFEDKVIEPLLRRWGFSFHRQFLCDFWIGSQIIRGRVDFLVEDHRGPITLFENKFRILTQTDLDKAVAQAKSYALQLGIPSFVIASPEGFWLYQLRGNHEQLVYQINGLDLDSDISQMDVFRRKILLL